jgi:Zn-dependent protease with chaperone function
MDHDMRGSRQVMPPWLWVWLIGDVAILIPAEISDARYQIAEYTGHGDISARLTAGTPYKLLLLFAVLAALTYAILALGAVAAVFPHIRGRWVESRRRLAESDDPVIAEIQRFVSQYDPAIQVRVGVSNSQAARVYPVGWRTARIAVFLPLIRLWNSDRRAAEAILLHEVAHRRHGDQFVVGLGSPFTWLLRIWVPAFIVLGLVPVLVYAVLGGGELAQAVAGEGALRLVQPAVLLILPVTALWLAELNADCFSSQVAGPLALRNALLAMNSRRKPSFAARSLALLSHPPRLLRLRLTEVRRQKIAALLAAWPAVVILQLAVVIAGTLLAWVLISTSPHDTGIDLLAGTRVFLVSNRILMIAALALVLLWPVLARPWDRLWSVGARGDSGFRGHNAGRLPWAPYLAAAIIPAVLLGASFAPLPANFVTASSVQLTTAELRADLLTTASLGPGASQTALPSDLPATSSNHGCLAVLNGLSMATPPSTATRQAAAAFTAGTAGLQFEEVLRSYPPQEAAPAFEAITRTLTGCTRFTVGLTDPPGTGTETVTPTGAVALGSQSWSAAITFTITGIDIPTYTTLILIQAQNALAAIFVTSADGSPATLARKFAADAVEKLY